MIMVSTDDRLFRVDGIRFWVCRATWDEPSAFVFSVWASVEVKLMSRRLIEATNLLVMPVGRDPSAERSRAQSCAVLRSMTNLAKTGKKTAMSMSGTTDKFLNCSLKTRRIQKSRMANHLNSSSKLRNNSNLTFRELDLSLQFLLLTRLSFLA